MQWCMGASRQKSIAQLLMFQNEAAQAQKTHRRESQQPRRRACDFIWSHLYLCLEVLFPVQKHHPGSSIIPAKYIQLNKQVTFHSKQHQGGQADRMKRFPKNVMRTSRPPGKLLAVLQNHLN